jgi:hypothetical protein
LTYGHDLPDGGASQDDDDREPGESVERPMHESAPADHAVAIRSFEVQQRAHAASEATAAAAHDARSRATHRRPRRSKIWSDSR